MPINYTTLTGTRDTDGSIKNWANHSGIPSGDMLTFAQAWIYQRLRVRQMLTTLTGTLTASNDTESLPTRYRGPNLFMFTGTNKSVPRRRLLDHVISQWSYDAAGARTVGKPRIWATDEANLQFDVQANINYPFLFRYYQALPALSTAAETNFLTDEFPALLNAAVLFKANEWKKDPQEKSYWLQIAMKEIEDANVESDLEMEGMDLQVQVDGEM